MASKNEKSIKNISFEVKSINDDGTFEGYGSVFGNVDSYGDVVSKGAFTKTLTERQGKIAMLWQHDSTVPIGVYTNLDENDTGLKVQGKLALKTQKGAEAYELLKMGAVQGLSIGYAAVKENFDKDSGIRYINEAKLYEISLVTFPANEEATVTAVKSETMFDKLTNEQKELVVKYINKITGDSLTDGDEPLDEEVKHSTPEGAESKTNDEPQEISHSLEKLIAAIKSH